MQFDHITICGAGMRLEIPNAVIARILGEDKDIFAALPHPVIGEATIEIIVTAICPVMTLCWTAKPH